MMARAVIDNRMTVYCDSFYRDLSTFDTFGRGWLRRNDKTRECALEMACGVRDRLNVDWGISVTGIAGPGGATPTKPVGTVCFGWASSHGVFTKRMHFNGSRKRVQKQAIGFALHELLKSLN